MISVIIPTYNSSNYIYQTIQSVVNQTYKNWEIILVDDGSADQTISIVKDFIRKGVCIDLVELAENNGFPAIPRNIGIDRSKGEYIAFLDSDDAWHPQKLEIQLDFMKKNNVEFSSTRMLCFRSNEELNAFQSTKFIKEQLKIKKIRHNGLLLKNIIPNSSVVVKSSLIKKQKFNQSPSYRAIEDYYCWLLLHQKIEFSIKVQTKLLFYRKNNEISISKSKIDMFKKNHLLYSTYSKGGKPLGVKKFIYLASYTILSLVNRFIRREM